MKHKKTVSHTDPAPGDAAVLGAGLVQGLDTRTADTSEFQPAPVVNVIPEMPVVCAVSGDRQGDAAEHTSSGDTSLSVTPKDVDSKHASSRDVFERHLNAENADERQQDLLDDAIDLSFPASDPTTSAGGITRIESSSRPGQHRSQRLH